MVKTRYFAEKQARSNLVCFKDMADKILNELRKNSIKIFVDIVVAAAKIIKANILQMLNAWETYPIIQCLDCLVHAKTQVLEILQIFLSTSYHQS